MNLSVDLSKAQLRNLEKKKNVKLTHSQLISGGAIAVSIHAPHVKKVMSAVNSNKGIVLKPDFVAGVNGGKINNKKIVKELKTIGKEALKGAVAGVVSTAVTTATAPVMGAYAPIAGVGASSLVGHYVNPKIDGLGIGSLNGYPTNPNNILSNIQRGGSFRSVNGDGIKEHRCFHCGGSFSSPK